MDHPEAAVPVLATVFRWSARIISILILLFWGFFLFAHLFGGDGGATRPLNARDVIGLTTMLTSLAGLIVAWKWEFAGAMMTLIAMAIGAIVNWRVLMFPFVLVPITGVLFLASWWIRRARGDSAITELPGA